MPWRATITCGCGADQWDEQACAENTREQYSNEEYDVPTAAKPDV